jgi:hypothetical protein
MTAHQPTPLEIDPRRCRLCGRKIDQHKCFDGGEGPEFFCYQDDDLVKQWELADPRDRWKHTGEAPPPEIVRNSDISAKPPKAPSYRTPQATIDAFFYVAALGDADGLVRWLAQHPLDAPYLRKIWRANARA